MDGLGRPSYVAKWGTYLVPLHNPNDCRNRHAAAMGGAFVIGLRGIGGLRVGILFELFAAGANARFTNLVPVELLHGHFASRVVLDPKLLLRLRGRQGLEAKELAAVDGLG